MFVLYSVYLIFPDYFFLNRVFRRQELVDTKNIEYVCFCQKEYWFEDFKQKKTPCIKYVECPLTLCHPNRSVFLNIISTCFSYSFFIIFHYFGNNLFRFFFGYKATMTSPAMAMIMAIRTVMLFVLKNPVAGKMPSHTFS